MSDIDEGFRSELRLKPGQKWAWEYESLPSWREDAFLNRTRFPSIKAALEAFEEWFKFAQPWEIARVFED